jgi:hypothetical protein
MSFIFNHIRNNNKCSEYDLDDSDTEDDVDIQTNSDQEHSTTSQQVSLETINQKVQQVSDQLETINQKVQQVSDQLSEQLETINQKFCFGIDNNNKINLNVHETDKAFIGFVYTFWFLMIFLPTGYLLLK